VNTHSQQPSQNGPTTSGLPRCADATRTAPVAITASARWAWRGLAALGLAWLSACGGESGDSTPPSEPATLGADHLPLAVGDRWVYRDAKQTLRVREAASTETAGSVAGILLKDYLLTDTVRSGQVVVKTDAQYLELPEADDPVGVRIGPVLNWSLPMKEGQPQTLVDKVIDNAYDIDGDQRGDRLHLRVTTQLEGRETLTVPAGQFNNAAKVRTRVHSVFTGSASGSTVVIQITQDEWFAPGVGLLQQVLVTDNQGTVTTESHELMAYRVGGSASERVAARLQGSTPAADSTSTAEIAVLKLNFDRAVDLDTLRSGGLSLKDATGQAVPFSLEQDASGQTVTAFPSRALGQGKHTLVLTEAARDMLGTPVATRSWSLSVDRQGPQLTSATPAVGAVDVDTNTAIRLVFDEDLLAATVSASAITLASGQGGQVPFTLAQPDARTLLITPTVPLITGTRYQLSMASSVTDGLGNPVAGANSLTHFRTVQGHLAAATRLPGTATRLLALGDIDDDGLSDVIGALVDAQGRLGALQWHKRTAGGVFALPQALNLPGVASCGPVISVAVGDLDRDNRTDLVAAFEDCPVSAFYKQADNSYRRQGILTNSKRAELRLIDFNKDGRVDLLTRPPESPGLRYALQNANGTWQGAQDLVLHDGATGPALIGDLNGDGTLDVAMVVSTGGADDTGLSMTFQKPDGKFTARSLLGITGIARPLAATLADWDGDGKTDVLVAGASGTGLRWLRQKSTGYLSQPILLTRNVPDAQQLLTADANRDGQLDVLVIGETFINLHLQQAENTVATQQPYDRDGRTGMVMVVDVNGDGWPDLLVDGPAVMINRQRADAKTAGASGGSQKSTSSLLQRLSGGLVGRKQVLQAQ
jgi:hypothetical protein